MFAFLWFISTKSILFYLIKCIKFMTLAADLKMLCGLHFWWALLKPWPGHGKRWPMCILMKGWISCILMKQFGREWKALLGNRATQSGRCFGQHSLLMDSFVCICYAIQQSIMRFCGLRSLLSRKETQSSTSQSEYQTGFHFCYIKEWKFMHDGATNVCDSCVERLRCSLAPTLAARPQERCSFVFCHWPCDEAKPWL